MRTRPYKARLFVTASGKTHLAPARVTPWGAYEAAQKLLDRLRAESGQVERSSVEVTLLHWTGGEWVKAGFQTVAPDHVIQH